MQQRTVSFSTGAKAARLCESMTRNLISEIIKTDQAIFFVFVFLPGFFFFFSSFGPCAQMSILCTSLQVATLPGPTTTSRPVDRLST